MPQLPLLSHSARESQTVLAVAVGTPAVVARSKKSRTAPYLAAVLGG